MISFCLFVYSILLIKSFLLYLKIWCPTHGWLEMQLMPMCDYTGYPYFRMQSYVESVRQNIAGQGKVLELGSVNGTGFSVNSMHSTSSTAVAAHGVHSSINSTAAHGVHNSKNSTAAAPSIHSCGYHSSTSSQGLWFLSL